MVWTAHPAVAILLEIASIAKTVISRGRSSKHCLFHRVRWFVLPLTMLNNHARLFRPDRQADRTHRMQASVLLLVHMVASFHARNACFSKQTHQSCRPRTGLHPCSRVSPGRGRTLILCVNLLHMCWRGGATLYLTSDPRRCWRRQLHPHHQSPVLAPLCPAELLTLIQTPCRVLVYTTGVQLFSLHKSTPVLLLLGRSFISGPYVWVVTHSAFRHSVALSPSACIFRPNRLGTRKIWAIVIPRPPAGLLSPKWNRSSVKGRWPLSTCSWHHGFLYHGPPTDSAMFITRCRR